MKKCKKKSESKVEKSERNFKVKNAERNVKEKICRMKGIVGKKENAEGKVEVRLKILWERWR